MENTQFNRKRFVVVLGLAKLTVIKKIENARAFVAKITGNINFSNPNPPLKEVSGGAGKLETSWEEAQSGDHEKTQIMYKMEIMLDNMLTKLGHYVEDIANDNSNPEAVILSAGMKFKRVPMHTARKFSVKNGRLKGTVDAVTKAAEGRASYIWQFRLKETAVWTTSDTTVKAKHTYKNLTSGSTYEFRQATVTKLGQGDWTDELELVVL